MGVLMLAVFGLSLYQLYLFNFAPNPSTYSGVPAQPGIMPRDDNRGVFLQLVPGSDGRFPSNLVQLLETTAPDAVAPDIALRVKQGTVAAIVVNQAVIDDPQDYRVYRPGQSEDYQFDTQRLPGGKLLTALPRDGRWLPGQHLVDVPSGGMFDTGRFYYTFVIYEE